MDDWHATLLQVIQVCFCFAVGSSVGSFLNVVVFRLPRGIGLLHPSSHCPICEHSIAFTDNVPVLGWIRLRGRCRNCRCRISARYPLVEAGVGLLAVLLAYLEFFSAGINLPDRSSAFPLPPSALVATLLYHFFLICSLLCLALIELDGRKIPRILIAVSLGIGLVTPAIQPSLHPVPAATSLPTWLAEAGWLVGTADGLAGFLVGLLLGISIGLLRRRDAENPRRRRVLLYCFATTGTFLGWQAVLTTTVIFFGLFFLVRIPLQWRSNPSMYFLGIPLAIATLLQIVFWRSMIWY